MPVIESGEEEKVHRHLREEYLRVLIQA